MNGSAACITSAKGPTSPTPLKISGTSVIRLLKSPKNCD
jgi:hypothetical protein